MSRAADRGHRNIDPRNIEAVTRRTLVDLAMSEPAKVDLMSTAGEFDCRLLHIRGVHYFQSLETTGFTQGRARDAADKS
eukprot:6382869-Karenia_brevis.AAC.1